MVVDVVGEFHETKGVADRPLYLPRQVARVDWKAMTSNARSGIKPHEAEGFGRGCVKGPPHIDTQVIGEHGDLVDQRDVDMAERVLDQLDQFRLTGRLHRNRPLHEGPVEVLHRTERRLVDTRHHFRGVRQAPLRIAGVEALRAVSDQKITAGCQLGAVFEDRHQ